MKVSEVINLSVKFNHDVNGIKTDSRNVKKNDIFVIIKGVHYDGFDFIDEAINNKAKTIVSSNKKILEYNDNKLYNRINFIYVYDEVVALNTYLKTFYKAMLDELCLIGVTGTNGKTTITTLVYKYFRYLGKNITLIGTNGIYLNDEYYKTTNTTPVACELFYYLEKSYKQNIKTIVMEVSSHGIKEGRIRSLDFDIGLLTNITLDHLDFHKTFTDYYYTKLFFINNCKIKIVNSDIEYFKDINVLIKDLISYGHQEISDYYISNEHLDIIESNFDLTLNKDNKFYINTSLLGEYNVSNVAAFISIINQLDMFNQYTLSFLKKKIFIEGRFESIKTSRGTFIIDFAHTPDSIEKILTFVNKVKTSKVITIFGMGGNRDKSKRRIVGEIVSRLSDLSVITSDNPRNENPLEIIEDIMKGIDTTKKDRYIIEVDRRKAIEIVSKISRSEDIILILGKGSEKYQIINEVYYEYSDKEEVVKYFNKLGE